MTRRFLTSLLLGIALLGCAFWAASQYFAAPVFSVTALASTSARPFAGGADIRLKGVPMYGTVEAENNVTRFIITDCQNDLPVELTAPLPPQFREGRNVTLTGTLDTDNIFHARKVKLHRSENCDAGIPRSQP